jgi:transposase-like protein
MVKMMRTNSRLIQKYRSYSEDFKRSLVSDFESGKFTVAQLGRLHKIKVQVIYNWIYKYSTTNERGIIMVEKSQSSTQKMKDLEKRISELERAVGQKQIKIDYLEKMIEIAKTDLNIDIKKNYNTPPSVGSERTKVK